MCQKRPIIRQKRPTNTSIPEVCINVKRALFIRQKRPITRTKETYRYTGIPEVCGMHKCQERPNMCAKETYSYGKRGLLPHQPTSGASKAFQKP